MNECWGKQPAFGLLLFTSSSPPLSPPPNIWALLCDCNAYRYANAFSLRGVVGWLCARGLLLPSAVLVNLGSWILGGGEVDVLPSYCS